MKSRRVDYSGSEIWRFIEERIQEAGECRIWELEKKKWRADEVRPVVKQMMSLGLITSFKEKPGRSLIVVGYK